ncbi:MAG: hypothetical protein Q9184_006995 [Pyrenodesmia sp. 2 TL-2023]
MNPVITTPRLKLTLLTQAKRGSPEFECLHALRSDEKATWWSIHGQAKTVSDTEKFITCCLPSENATENEYRVAYAVHSLLEPPNNSLESNPQPADQKPKPTTRFIGLITLVSLDATSLPLPAHLTLPPTAAPTTLTVELAYQFLPISWGQGHATESISAVFEACKGAPTSFWSPYTKVYVRAIVNEENGASLRVMEKTGMVDRGVYEWTGRAVFLAGEWTERSRLHICGRYVLE